MLRPLTPFSSSLSLPSRLLKDWKLNRPRLVTTNASKKDVMRKPANIDSTQLDDLKGILLRGLLNPEPKKVPPKAKKVASVNPSPKKPKKKNTNVDWVEKPDVHLIKAYLPGLSREDVSITIDGRTINVSTRERQQEEETKNDDKWHMRCVLWQQGGSFSHKFEIPEGVKMSEMVARWENEALAITIPKEPSHHMASSINIL